MERDALISLWLAEENSLGEGWDFSHLDGRCEESPLPWNYKERISAFLTEDMQLLDIDTGGGELLRSLNHPPRNTSATEGYPPNVELCRRELCPLGIDFRPGKADALPFRAESFHMVIDRHGDFDAAEIFRVLKPGGIFITQQVGAKNDREFVELLMGDLPLPYPNQTLEKAKAYFSEVGFSILCGMEHFGTMRFSDVGALVWFAKAIPWEFPDFSVATHEDALWRAHEICCNQGFLEGKTHRFLLIAQKPNRNLTEHYDGLLAAGNDPVKDPPDLKAYMDRWDGDSFLEKLNLSRADSVLEIGVGTGRLALRTAPLCGRFTGVEIAPETAKRAAAYLASFSHAKVMCGDFLTCPLEESYDVIYASLTLFHFEFKESLVRRVASLLRSGGRVLFSLDKQRDRQIDCGFGTVPLYPEDPARIIFLLGKYGLEASSSETEAATLVFAKKS